MPFSGSWELLRRHSSITAHQFSIPLDVCSYPEQVLEVPTSLVSRRLRRNKNVLFVFVANQHITRFSQNAGYCVRSGCFY